jgi:hypothetical protein
MEFTRSGLLAPGPIGPIRSPTCPNRASTPDLSFSPLAVSRAAASLWFTVWPPALTPARTLRPWAASRAAASLWLNWWPPALTPVLTFSPLAASRATASL